jgi:hypothetical protein
VAIAGCPPRPLALADRAPRVRLRIADRAEVTAGLGPGTQVLERLTLPTGRRVPVLRGDRRRGYLLSAPGSGVFHVSAGGRKVRAAPNRVSPWRWQRHLIGRVLPFAAALAGLEPFHASAVAGEAGGVVFAGESGLGKSTLAAGLVLAGWRLLTDDVLAVSVADGAARAHPGAGLLWVRPPTMQSLGTSTAGRLGEVVGRARDGVRLAVPVVTEAVAVRAIYLLEPAGARGPAGLAPPPAALAARLLASSFNAVLLAPDRLARQLDACAALAAGARIVTLHIDPRADPRATAETVLEDLANQGMGP